ncbi:hypothetical protein BDV29DRAFT_121286 [Aspergillus leporis]|jgi:hypothetical protein|uniref:Uncharacterized protein n=1 Tax=Aspergillus leporis TaxID=41062 RepID=A0A5N5XE05_9EURO|nr:hypothetical protein BDV29DRAFT_121286 [Aspergillus leporis]
MALHIVESNIPFGLDISLVCGNIGYSLFFSYTYGRVCLFFGQQVAAALPEACIFALLVSGRDYEKQKGFVR